MLLESGINPTSLELNIWDYSSQMISFIPMVASNSEERSGLIDATSFSVEDLLTLQ